MWKSVIQENAIENAFTSTHFSSVGSILLLAHSPLGTLCFCSTWPRRLLIWRRKSGTNEGRGAKVSAPTLSIFSSRKRHLEERLSLRKYDESVPRNHYGVDFDSSPKSVLKSIAGFLGENRVDIIGKQFKNNRHRLIFLQNLLLLTWVLSAPLNSATWQKT